MPKSEEARLEILRRVPGRIVLAEGAETLYLGRNYQLLVSRDAGMRWERVGSLPCSGPRRVVQASRLACRLLRQEIRALVHLNGDRLVAADRRAVFYRGPGEAFERSQVETGGLPLLPPMRLTVGPKGVVLFGEYASGVAGRPKRLFASSDGGAHFEPIFEFPPGDILHVHNLIYDEGLGHYWVLTGDFAQQPGIGILSGDLRHFEWFRRGQQRFRAVELFDLGDRLLYATDTHLEPNRLVSLEKASGRLEEHGSFEGSCIYACRFGGLFAMTTTVEDSPVNHSRDATLWLSRNGYDWKCAYRARKDRWSAKYFQFGSIVLPSGRTQSEAVAFSGQAVQGIDGLTLIARLVSRGEG